LAQAIWIKASKSELESFQIPSLRFKPGSFFGFHLKAMNLQEAGAMELMMPAMEQRMVQQQMGDQLLISACGRTCSVDIHHSRSIVDLQAALQRTLQMEGQAFHICDINGALLSTDMQVQDAIEQGLTPLCATLPDKSLHHLENRREELAQMQWKLVRDQMTKGSNQVTQLTRQLSEIQFQVQAIQREASNGLEHFRAEYCKGMQVERDTTKAEMQPIQEGVNGAVLLINGERSKRELSVQGFEKHIHGVCDMLDGERASRRQDLAMHMTVIQELRTSLDVERNGRMELEEVVMDLKKSNLKFQEDMSAMIRQSEERVYKVQSDMGVADSDNSIRFGELEERAATIENSLQETTAWTTGSLDKLGERHERVSQAVETMRLSSKHQEGSIANCLERVNELESLVLQVNMDTTELVTEGLSKEKQLRDEQVRRTLQVFTNENLKQITEVEKRLTMRLERESAAREKNFQTMIDEVTKVVEDRKLFRDQTITKTESRVLTVTPRAVEVGANGHGILSSRVVAQEYETGGMIASSPGPWQRAVSEVTISDGLQAKAQPRGQATDNLSQAGSSGTCMPYGGLVTENISPSGTPRKVRVPGSLTRSATSPIQFGSYSITVMAGGAQMMPQVQGTGSLPGSRPGSFRAPLTGPLPMSPGTFPTSPVSVGSARGGSPVAFGAVTSPRRSFPPS